MSVVRFGDSMLENSLASAMFGPYRDGSQVYVLYTSGDRLECCGCALASDIGSFSCDEDKPAEMVAHLKEHVAAGHRVPPWAIKNLEACI